MSIQVTCDTDQQLIIAKISGPLDPVGDPLGLAYRVAECMAAMEANPIYRILDLSAITLSFGEMVFALAVETRDMPGTFYDLRVVHVVITADEDIRNSILALEYPSIHIVKSMQEACRYITQHRRAHAQNEGPPRTVSGDSGSK